MPNIKYLPARRFKEDTAFGERQGVGRGGGRWGGGDGSERDVGGGRQEGVREGEDGEGVRRRSGVEVQVVFGFDLDRSYKLTVRLNFRITNLIYNI